MTELLNCPFCGGEAEVREWDWPYTRFQCRCSVCKCQARARMAERAKAITAWNRRAPEGTLTMAEWQPIETAPMDGTDIQARIPGHGEDNVIAWQVDAFLDDLGAPCGGWAFTTEQEPPDCWTDGICWAFNEDGVPSVQPTHWTPLPPAPETDNG